MAQTNPPRPLALVVEDDKEQRDTLAQLLEENQMQVIQCESAEAACVVLSKMGFGISFLFTGVELAGLMDGASLAVRARRRYPNITIVVTSGQRRPRDLPSELTFIPKPWQAADILREAGKSARL
jgi:DNA-binding NtrC family response regulator